MAKRSKSEQYLEAKRYQNAIDFLKACQASGLDAQTAIALLVSAIK